MGEALHKKTPGLGYDRDVRQLDAVAGVQEVKRLWFSLSSLPPILLGPDGRRYMVSDKSSSLDGWAPFRFFVVGHMMAQPRTLISPVVIWMVCAGLLFPVAMPAAQVQVRYREGLVHGFLVLSSLDGEPLADGDLIQLAVGDRVTSHLVFRFKDGSLHDETVVFSQSHAFRLLQDHLVQKGPAFPHPIDFAIDATTSQVTVRYTEDGKQKVTTDHLKLAPDVANGLVLTLLKNIRSGATGTKVSMVAAAPKPRVVTLAITSKGEEGFSLGRSSRKATHHVIKVEIGGLTGVVAPLVGKEPPDTHVWILEGEAPVVVKSEGPLYVDGPIWRIELASPVWSHASAAGKGPGNEIKP
jgi:hypothetical protein